ncbi:MAG: DUF1311 domain-containing protein [Saprospiraceae bacterium]|nr:DUF1311 domain-containing protein [Saprospiraceae bacterium]
MRHLLLFVILIFLGFNVRAQTQLEMNLDAQKSYKSADLELNKVYKLLMKELDPEAKALLKKAQQDWIKYRDSHCTFEGQMFEGGSAQPMVISSCMEIVTKARTEELKVSLEDRKL